jgi:hypothetical protein
MARRSKPTYSGALAHPDKIRKNTNVSKILAFIVWMSGASLAMAEDAGTEGRSAFSFAAGVGTPTALIEMVRVRQLEIQPQYISVLGYSHKIWGLSDLISVELEATLAKHFERSDRFSGAGAVLVRWLKTPWDRIVKSSFAFGNGLSYATSPPQLEVDFLERTSRLLYHFSLESAFEVQRGWDLFFRIHHRSGAFGMFNNVVGGSDFLCLGVRRRI